MELSIQERLKDLRVERGLTLEQLEEQVNLSKSALGSYEAKRLCRIAGKENKDTVFQRMD